MTQQFTASEVRAEAHRHANEVEDMLNAFADRLEADEKAEAIGFLSAGALAALVDCRSDDYNGNVDLWMRSNDAVKATIPVYTRPSPSDAERLAEALHDCIRDLRIAVEYGKTMRNPKALLETVERAEKALAAHSAQAQPPAARVSDEMVERARSAFVKADDGSTGITEAIRAALLAAQETKA